MSSAFTLSAIVGEPSADARGLIVALHGGGSRAAYWHSPVDPLASLVDTGARVNWRVIALDRPGYGASADLRGRRLSVADQVPLVLAAAARLGGDLPVVLVGHSLGALVAVTCAAQQPPERLIGLSLAGVPLKYTSAQQASLRAVDLSAEVLGRPSGPSRPVADWFGPADRWDPRLLEHRRTLFAPTPSGEFADARDAPLRMPRLLRTVRTPTQVVAAGHEATTAASGDILEVARVNLVGAPFVDLVEIPGSGHNLSLGHDARAYHLRVLAFAEQARARSPVTQPG